eukprot:403331942
MSNNQQHFNPTDLSTHGIAQSHFGHGLPLRKPRQNNSFNIINSHNPIINGQSSNQQFIITNSRNLNNNSMQYNDRSKIEMLSDIQQNINAQGSNNIAGHADHYINGQQQKSIIQNQQNLQQKYQNQHQQNAQGGIHRNASLEHSYTNNNQTISNNLYGGPQSYSRNQQNYNINQQSQFTNLSNADHAPGSFDYDMLNNLNSSIMKRTKMQVKSSEKHHRNQVLSRGGIFNYSRPRTNSPFPHMREKNGKKILTAQSDTPEGFENTIGSGNNGYFREQTLQHNSHYNNGKNGVMTKIQLIPMHDDRIPDNNSVDLNSTNIYDSLNNSATGNYNAQVGARQKGGLGLMKINDQQNQDNSLIFEQVMNNQTIDNSPHTLNQFEQSFQEDQLNRSMFYNSQPLQNLSQYRQNRHTVVGQDLDNSINQSISIANNSQSISPGGHHSKKISNANIDCNQPPLVLSPHSIKFAAKGNNDGSQGRVIEGNNAQYHNKSLSGQLVNSKQEQLNTSQNIQKFIKNQRGISGDIYHDSRHSLISPQSDQFQNPNSNVNMIVQNMGDSLRGYQPQYVPGSSSYASRNMIISDRAQRKQLGTAGVIHSTFNHGSLFSNPLMGLDQALPIQLPNYNQYNNAANIYKTVQSEQRLRGDHHSQEISGINSAAKQRFILEPIKENSTNALIQKSRMINGQLKRKNNSSILQDSQLVPGQIQNVILSAKQNDALLAAQNFRVETNKAKPKIMKLQKLKDVFTTPQKNINLQNKSVIMSSSIHASLAPYSMIAGNQLEAHLQEQFLKNKQRSLSSNNEDQYLFTFHNPKNQDQNKNPEDQEDSRYQNNTGEDTCSKVNHPKVKNSPSKSQFNERKQSTNSQVKFLYNHQNNGPEEQSTSTTAASQNSVGLIQRISLTSNKKKKNRIHDKLVMMTRNGGIYAIHGNSNSNINNNQLNLNGSSINITGTGEKLNLQNNQVGQFLTKLEEQQTNKAIL